MTLISVLCISTTMYASYILAVMYAWKHTTYVSTKYVLDAATSSGILKAKQKLGRTFNSDKLGGIAFTKVSKLTMCSA